MTDNPESKNSSKTPSGPLPVSTIGREVLTFLECAEEGKIATKRFRSVDYKPVKNSAKCTWWKPQQHAVNDLWGAYELFKQLSENPRIMHVRGALVDPKKQRILRRHKKRGDEEATLAAKGRYLNWIDVDGVNIPGLDYQNPWPAVSAWARTVKQFRDADLVINLSSSWGIKEGVRLHIAYWSDRPLEDRESRAFADSLPFPCDPAIYTPSQPFYFADPVFTDTFDPLLWESRWSYLSCDEGSGEVHIDTGTAGDELKHWLGRIADLGEGTPRHSVINSAGYFLGRYVKGGVWSSDELTAKLVEACIDSGAFDEERIGAAEDEIRRAIADGVSDSVEELGSWRDRAHRREEGGLKSDEFNLLLILREHPAVKGILRYDVRRMRRELVYSPPWGKEGDTYPRKLRDVDVVECVAWMNTLGVSFPKNRTHDAIDAVAQDNAFDECLDYVRKLSWDGVQRCCSLYTSGAGAKANEWSRKMSLLTMDALISRIMNWGCKVDVMPILQGEEGVFKSTFFKELVAGISSSPDRVYFSDCMGDYQSNQKFGEALGPYLIVEDGELDSLRSRELESVMRQITSQMTVYRPAYAREEVERKRACLLVGTTNDKEFLDGTRTNRRFPVIEVGKINIAWVIENRDQLFAEARVRFEKGIARPWLDREEIKMQVEENAAFQMTDPWESAIGDWLSGLSTGATDFESVKRDSMTAHDVLSGALGVPVAQQNHGMARRVGKVLRKLGWEPTVFRVNGRLVKKFSRWKEITEKIEKEIDERLKRVPDEEFFKDVMDENGNLVF